MDISIIFVGVGLFISFIVGGSGMIVGWKGLKQAKVNFQQGKEIKVHVDGRLQDTIDSLEAQEALVTALVEDRRDDEELSPEIISALENIKKIEKSRSQRHFMLD